MSKYLLILLLAVSPAAAQVKSTIKGTAKSAAAQLDVCAPVGRTADGTLVYSMKCENLPAPPKPPAPPPQAEAKEAPPAAEPEPEVRRSGIFGWSYDRR